MVMEERGWGREGGGENQRWRMEKSKEKIKWWGEKRRGLKARRRYILTN